MEKKIRKARSGDLKEIAKIMMEESVKKPYNEKFTPGSAKKDVLGFFKDSLYVATYEEKVIGFIASHIVNSDKTKAYIDELWIRSGYQGKGVGKMLVKFVEDMYKKKGLEMGFRVVESGPLVRSSYHADVQVKQLHSNQ